MYLHRLMALPNIIALFALNGVVVAEVKSYVDRKKQGQFLKN